LSLPREIVFAGPDGAARGGRDLGDPRRLWFLAVGFEVVTLGILLGGVLDQLLRFSVLTDSSLPVTFDLGLFVVTMKAVTLAFGTILTWLSYRAFRRTGAPALRALTVGIGLLTAGAVLGGLLTCSLYVDGPGADRHVPPDSQGLISPQSGGHTWTLLSRSDSPASVTSEPHSVATSNGRAATSWH